MSNCAYIPHRPAKFLRVLFALDYNFKEPNDIPPPQPTWPNHVKPLQVGLESGRKWRLSVICKLFQGTYLLCCSRRFLGVYQFGTKFAVVGFDVVLSVRFFFNVFWALFSRGRVMLLLLLSAFEHRLFFEFKEPLLEDSSQLWAN